MSRSPAGAADRVEAPAAPGRQRAAPLTVAGVVLLVLGLGCLGWVGYQYVGSNVVAERRFDTVREDLRGRWADPATAARPASPRRSAAPEPGAPPASGEALALLRIPAFGADYEVPIVEGTKLDDLTRGVGHYRGTARPGEVGNFAVAGHRVTHGEPFARLLELDPGDEVVVETASAVYTYVLDVAPRDLTVASSATWVLDPVPGKPADQPGRALITLTTCQDLFRSPDRSIAFGHLASTRNK